jgi:hypothetical protein
VVIRRGEPWGEVVPRPTDLAVARADRDVARTTATIGLTGGDLLRTVGGSGRLDDTLTVAPIDLVRVDTEDSTAHVAAHLIARRSWWRGEIVAVMNAQFVGEWDVAPRSHPNDGKVDVVRVDPSMSVRDRWRARSRLATGTHVPHPAVSVRQVASIELDFARPMDLYLDGERWQRARRVRITVLPDAVTIAF